MDISIAATGLLSVGVFALLAEPWLKSLVRKAARRGRLHLRLLVAVEYSIRLMVAAASAVAVFLILVQAKELSTDGWVFATGVLAFAAGVQLLRAGSWRVRERLLGSLEGRVINDRAEVYRYMEQLSLCLRTGDEVAVSSLEDAPAHYVTENPESAAFMIAWQHAVRKKSISVKHLVRVFDNPEDLSNLEERLRTYADLERYELGVVVWPPPRPFIDLYILKRSFVLLGFSGNSTAPALMTSAIFLGRKTVVEAITDYFENTFWPAAHPVKTRFGIDEVSLSAVRSANGVLQNIGSMTVWSDLPGQLASLGPLGPAVVELLKALSGAIPFASFRRDPLFASQVVRLIFELKDLLRQLQPEVASLAGSARSALEEHRAEVRSLISAVSLIESESYWSSSEGRAQEALEEALTRRGVQIRRIFVVASTEGISGMLRAVIERQRGYLGEANIAIVEVGQLSTVEVPLMDFAIIDESLVIHDRGSDCAVYRDYRVVKRFVAIFEATAGVAGLPAVDRSNPSRLREERHMPTPVKVFVAYAHADEPFLLQVNVRLAQLRRDGLISVWYDREIEAGIAWRQKIIDELDAADVVLVLVSPDFIASDFGWETELTRAIQRHRDGDARVVPVILRPCEWKETPLGELQALPKHGLPIVKWENQDDALLDVATGLRRAISSLRGGTSVAT